MRGSNPVFRQQIREERRKDKGYREKVNNRAFLCNKGMHINVQTIDPEQQKNTLLNANTICLQFYTRVEESKFIHMFYASSLNPSLQF
jgi:hypothetical protein